MREPGLRMARQILLGAFVFAALAAAPSASSAQLRVACVGDSITYGVGVTDRVTSSYPSQLQGLLPAGSLVQNDGHSGACILHLGQIPYRDQSEYTAATMFATAAARTNIVIMLGANDSKPPNWAHSADLLTDTETLIDHFAALGQVWLVLPPPAWPNTHTIDGTIIHDDILPVLRQAAAARGVPLIDIYDTMLPHPEYFTLDGIHPNEAGALLIAQTIADALQAGPPADAGVDAAVALDAGASADSGVAADSATLLDAGSSSVDAGAQADASHPAPSSGCTCSVGAPPRRIDGMIVALGLAMCVVRRAARRGRRSA